MLKQAFKYFSSAILFVWLVLLSLYVCLHVYQSSAFSEQAIPVKLEKMHEKTWGYLLHEKYHSLPNIKGYTIKERRHLLDVKRRISQLEKLLVLATVLGLFLLTLNAYNYGQIREVIKATSKIEIRFIVLTGTLALLAFKPLFSLFHQLLFNEGSWVFLEESYLIQLFPYHYFLEFFLLFLAVLAFFQVCLMMTVNKGGLKTKL